MSEIRLGLVIRSIDDSAPRYLADYFPHVRDAHNHSTRSGDANVGLYRFRSNRGKDTIFYTVVSERNVLPLTIKTTSSLGKK